MGGRWERCVATISSLGITLGALLDQQHVDQHQIAHGHGARHTPSANI